MSTHQLELEGNTISYHIQRSRRRKRTISIKVRHDQVRILVPQRTPKLEIEALLRTRAAWILTQQAQLQEREAQRPAAKCFVDGERFSYLGEPFELRLDPDVQQTHLVKQLLLTPAAPPAVVREELIAWYYQQAAEVFADRAAIHCTQMNVGVPVILVRNQRKRWGSCNSKGELRLNWRLLMTPLPLLDYVLLHELVHLEHMNHSKAFWQRVEALLPDYKQREEALKTWAYVFDVI